MNNNLNQQRILQVWFPTKNSNISVQIWTWLHFNGAAKMQESIVGACSVWERRLWSHTGVCVCARQEQFAAFCLELLRASWISNSCLWITKVNTVFSLGATDWRSNHRPGGTAAGQLFTLHAGLQEVSGAREFLSCDSQLFFFFVFAFMQKKKSFTNLCQLLPINHLLLKDFNRDDKSSTSSLIDCSSSQTTVKNPPNFSNVGENYKKCGVISSQFVVYNWINNTFVMIHIHQELDARIMDSIHIPS